MSGHRISTEHPARLQTLAESLVAAARKAGAEQADALATGGQSISIDVRNGALEQADRAEGIEIGLRVLIGGRQACVSAAAHRDDSIADMAARAVAMAHEAPVDDHLGLADPDRLAVSRDAGGLQIADDRPDPAA